MFNPEKLLGGLLGSAMSQHGQGSALGGLGGLGNLGGNLASGAGKAGLAMGLLGIATAAVEHFSEQRGQSRGAPGSMPPAAPPPFAPGSAASSRPAPPAAPPPPPPASPVAPGAASAAGSSDAASAAEEAVTYVRGMIAAAAADGFIDPQEREKILGQLETTGLDPEERDFLLREMDQPASIDSLSAAVRTPEQARNLYVCSLLAIEVDTDAERNHLRQLGERLGLASDALNAIHEQYNVSI